MRGTRRGDLIETLWDVKMLDAIAAGKKPGFNRNIVGCKVKKSVEVSLDVVDLIETLWDVK